MLTRNRQGYDTGEAVWDVIGVVVTAWMVGAISIEVLPMPWGAIGAGVAIGVGGLGLASIVKALWRQRHF